MTTPHFRINISGAARCLRRARYLQVLQIPSTQSRHSPLCSSTSPLFAAVRWGRASPTILVSGFQREVLRRPERYTQALADDLLVGVPEIHHAGACHDAGDAGLQHTTSLHRHRNCGAANLYSVVLRTLAGSDY